MNRIAAAALGALAVLGFSATADARKLSPEQKLDKVLAGRVAGEPSDCIYLPTVRSTRIIDRTAIVYDAGKVLWVNRPASGAATLDDSDVLVTRTHNSRLCSIDVVRLHDRTHHMQTGFVGLGEFVPYRKPSQVQRRQ
jgi:hypothetical protein